MSSAYLSGVGALSLDEGRGSSVAGRDIQGLV